MEPDDLQILIDELIARLDEMSQDEVLHVIKAIRDNNCLICGGRPDCPCWRDE